MRACCADAASYLRARLARLLGSSAMHWQTCHGQPAPLHAWGDAKPPLLHFQIQALWTLRLRALILSNFAVCCGRLPVRSACVQIFPALQAPPEAGAGRQPPLGPAAREEFGDLQFWRQAPALIVDDDPGPGLQPGAPACVRMCCAQPCLQQPACRGQYGLCSRLSMLRRPASGREGVDAGK